MNLKDYLIQLKKEHSYSNMHIHDGYCVFYDRLDPYAELHRTYDEGIKHIIQSVLSGEYVEQGLLLNPRLKEQYGLTVNELLNYYLENTKEI